MDTPSKYDELAPEGFTWICPACGKWSRSRSGFDPENKRVAEAGWDEACFLHAVLCRPATPEEHAAHGWAFVAVEESAP